MPHFRKWTWPLYAQLLQHSKLPILVGPWRGEVGFEVLYWLPWLAAVRTRYKIAPERLIPISRGGAAAWYQTPMGLELYAMRDPAAVRVEARRTHLARGMQKQARIEAWDRAVLEDAAATLGFRRYLTLHPAWMYQLLDPFWTGRRGPQWLLDRTQYQQPMPAPPLPQDITLPKEFVAVKFYHRSTFPPGDMTAVVARETIHQLAQEQDVVILTSGGHLDDHQDFIPKKRPTNVVLLDELIPTTAETSLAVQSAVLAKALGFVGTYGGIAQLALRMSKPNVSFFLDWGGTAHAHKSLSDLLALLVGVPCIVQRIADIPILKTTLPSLRLVAGAETMAIPVEAGARQAAPVLVT